MSRLTNIILVVFFAGLLLAPTVASLCGFNPMGKLDERRALAAKPRSCPTWRECLSSTSSVAALAQAWDKYYTDHFGLRKLLIGTYRLALFHVLRTSPNPAVVVGRSNGGQRWLFYDGTIANDGIGFESLLGKKPYTDQELALISRNLTRWTELAQRNGVKLLILPIPDKQSIYPENLPRRLQPTAGSRSRLDQFWTMAEKLKGVPLIDIRSALRTAKQTKQVYYATDNHWNEQGALIAYQLLMDALRLQDNGRGALPRDAIRWMPPMPGISDNLLVSGLPVPVGEWPVIPILPTSQPPDGSRRGKLLVLSDSFFEGIQPYFEYEFAVVKIRRTGRSAQQDLITQGLLDAEKPDALLLEAVERYWTS